VVDDLAAVTAFFVVLGLALQGEDKVERSGEAVSMVGQLADMPEEGHVRLHILLSPLVHRRHGTMRLRAAAVVLEQQYFGMVISWCRGHACRGPSP
jgi:hypothetical protein